jgi:hypothetical protein
MIQQDKPDLDDLAHFGTKGMKWGIRKSAKETGVSRTAGAKIDKNARKIARTQKIITRGQNDSFFKNSLRYGDAGAAFMRSERGQRVLQTRVAKLTAQSDRFAKGTTTTKDKIGAALTIGDFERAVSIRPR